MEIDKLDLKARGVLLTLLLLCDGNGKCEISARRFAVENGLSHREIRTIISKLQKTQWVTHLATHSGTQGTTHLTLNISAINNVSKNINRHIERHNERHNKQSILKTENDIDYDAFMVYFNTKVNGTLIPPIRLITETRKKHIKSLASKYGKAVLARVVDIAVNSPFLKGENDKGWAVTFDWIFNPGNFIKIMEGNYDEQRINTSPNQSSGRGQSRGATLQGVAREILRNCQKGGN